MSKKIRALVLFSGGLDSMLAIKILEAQNIYVEAICFESIFFNAQQARISAGELGLKLHVVDIAKQELELVKNPPSGYGKHLNPCIDCHSLMVKHAVRIKQEKGFDLVATGEVLGQRPFSQNKEALKKVEKLADSEILRPLSALALLVTKYERDGLVARRKLYGIEGRARAKQFELAKKYGIKFYPSPSGGCLLTDSGFSERLGRMLDYWPDCTINDVSLLKHGRIYWFKSIKTGKKSNQVLLVIGRKQEDNEELNKLAQKGDFMVELKEIMGPQSLIRNLAAKALIKDKANCDIPLTLKLGEFKILNPKTDREIMEMAALFTGYHSTKARGKKVNFEIIIK
ncbi:tRNA 4-thiouridine(8) synthase ThiI [bacterium]|nr:tRNA 4-thiouridine(8) synthase ThiI [bacterium]